MVLGISYNNVDKTSFLGLRRDFIIHPLAASGTYFVNAVSIASSVVGDTLTKTTAGGRPLFDGRLPTVTAVDASGTTLSITVRLTCRRFGRSFTQDVTCLGTSSGVAQSATHLVDEITSVKVVAIANNAASDTLAVGFDDTWLGLSCPIKSFKDVRMVIRDNNGTLDSGAQYSADIVTARVKAPSAGVDVKTLFAAIAANNIYMFEYEAAGGQQEDFPRQNGLRFN